MLDLRGDALLHRAGASCRPDNVHLGPGPGLERAVREVLRQRSLQEARGECTELGFCATALLNATVGWRQIHELSGAPMKETNAPPGVERRDFLPRAL